jgi:hypothetical protein
MSGVRATIPRAFGFPEVHSVFPMVSMIGALRSNPARTTKGLSYLYRIGVPNGTYATPDDIFSEDQITTALPPSNPTTGSNPFFQ